MIFKSLYVNFSHSTFIINLSCTCNLCILFVWTKINILIACSIYLELDIDSLYCRCEGTAQYRYSDVVSKEFEFGVGSEDGNKQVVDKLPEEMPFPTPFVGKMIIYMITR